MANITEILGTDSVSSLRPVINSNFELLNDELASITSITSLLDPNTASNGITESAGDIKLGGTLTAATSIALDTHDLKFEGIGNVDIGVTYATGNAKTFLETGKDILGLTAIGLPNGVDGFGAVYMEDGADLLNSNAATIIAGNLSDFGYAGTGTGISIFVGDIADILPSCGINLMTDSIDGGSVANIETTGFNAETSTVRMQAGHDADILYSQAQMVISGPSALKTLYLTSAGWGVADSVTGDSYQFPWTNGTAGQVLADDGLGSNNLEWVDIPRTTPFVSLTYGANIAWAVDTGASAQVILTGSTAVLDNPTGLLSGRTYNLIVKQSIGSGTLTYGSVFKWAGGVAPTLSTAPGAIDIFTFIYDGTNLYGSSINNFA